MRTTLFNLCLLLTNINFSLAQQRIEKIVDIKGNGDFTSIQDCVDAIGENDVATCFVREGRYHEVISINNKKDIEIKGDPNARPVLEGTVELRPKGKGWRINRKKKYCVGKIDNKVQPFQLFLDKEMMTNARWPNALWKDRTAFDEKYWGHSNGNSSQGDLVDYEAGKNKGYRKSVMVDDGQWLKKQQRGVVGLAESNINMTGTMAVLNVGSFNTFVKPVLWHEPGSDNFTYIDDFHFIRRNKKTGEESRVDIRYYPKNNRYYLDSSLVLLDAPGEWFYDNKTSKVSFFPFNDTCPDPKSGNCKCPDKNSGLLRGRVMDYSIIITNTTRASITNLDLFASSISATNNRKKPLLDMRLDSVNFYFPSSSKRMLKDFSPPKPTEVLASRKKGSVTVENCVFKGAEGIALKFEGNRSKVYNNLFEWNDWSGQMKLVASGGDGTVVGNARDKKSEFVGNTLSFNGVQGGYRPGMEAIVRDNIIEGQCHGNIQNDGAGIQVQDPQQPNTHLLRNWAFNSPKYALRFDGAPKRDNNGNLLSPLGHEGNMSFNVQWDSKPFQVKGDNQETLH